jgi:hypothetical protein
MLLNFLPLKTVIYFGTALVVVIAGLIAWAKSFK